MNRITPPQKFSSLKESKLWSIDWARDTFPQSSFGFYVLRKVAEGNYEAHGYAATPTEAFKLRRELVEETGVKNYFVRAKQIRKTTIWAESTNEDFFRDKHAEGVGLEDIPRHMRSDYLAYQRGRRTAR